MEIKDIQDQNLLELIRLGLDATLKIQIGLMESLQGSSTNEELIQNWMQKLAEARNEAIGVMANLEAMQEQTAKQKIDWIKRLYEGYYNTGQNTDKFSKEFFYSIGELLSGKQLKDLELKFLILEEIL